VIHADTIRELRERLSDAREDAYRNEGRLIEQIVQVTKERDDARRELCRHVFLNGGVPPREYAQAMGWDCFKENT
jgi:hypothetical protein